MPLRGRMGRKYLWCCGCQTFLDPAQHKSLKQHFRVVHRLEYQSGCPFCFTVRYRPGDVERHCWLVHGIALKTAQPPEGCKWFLCKARFNFKSSYPCYNDLPESDFCEYPLPGEDIAVDLQRMLAANSVSTSAVFSDPKLSSQAVVQLVRVPSPSSSSSDSSPAREKKDKKGGKSSVKSSGKPKKSRYTSVGTVRFKAIQESTTESSSDESSSERAGPSGACQLSAGTVSSSPENSPSRSPIPESMVYLPGFISEDFGNSKGSQTNISYSPRDKLDKNSKYQL